MLRSHRQQTGSQHHLDSFQRRSQAVYSNLFFGTLVSFRAGSLVRVKDA